MSLRVEPESLINAAAALRSVLTLMGDWDHSRAGLIGAAPHAGHPVMSDGIEQFCNEWDYGFGHIGTDLEEIASALETAARVYLETDGAIADAAGGVE